MTYNHHIVGPFARMEPSYFGVGPQDDMDEWDDEEDEVAEKSLSEYSYEEMIYASVNSKVFTVLFKLRELAELIGVEVNTKEPLPDGKYSPFQGHGEGWRSKTIQELVRDITAAL